MSPEPQCNCPGNGLVDAEHYVGCPLYQPPLTHAEIRQLRGLLKYLYPAGPSQPNQLSP